MIDVIVAGGGVFGLSVSLELARRGRDVQLVTAAPPGHAGASVAQTRIARLAYGTDTFLTGLALQGLTAWKRLEEASGRRFFLPAGVLHLLSAGEDPAWEHSSRHALAQLGARTEELDGKELGRRYAVFSPAGLSGALLECDGGVLLARDATGVLRDAAQDAGVRIIVGTARPAGEGIDIGGEFTAAHTVVWAVGAELPGLFPWLSAIAARTQDSYYLTRAAVPWHQMPAWLDRSAPAYGVPDVGSGVKFAVDTDRSPTELPATALPGPAGTYLRTRFPGLPIGAVRHEACSYATTPDEDFVIGLVPGSSKHWIAGGDSGHGFKHAPALARSVAEAIQGEKEPPARFRLDRLISSPTGAP